MPDSTNKRAIDFSDFAEASNLIATKAEVEAVRERVEELSKTSGVVFASRNEILNLFREDDQEQDGEEQGDEIGSG